MFNFTDDVNGVIIGGDYIRAWVSYCGRQQGRFVYATSKKSAIQKCEEIMNEIKKDCGVVFKDIYPKNEWCFNFD